MFDHLWLLDPSWERADNTEYMEKTVKNAFDCDVLGLTDEEKNARLDIGYRQSAGKHIIVELKRANRVVRLGELSQQISKYQKTMKKVLLENGFGNSPFEIICVLGRPIDNDDSADYRQVVSKSLEAFNARIVYYTELIENAYKAYAAYLKENEKSQPLIELFQQLEAEMN